MFVTSAAFAALAEDKFLAIAGQVGDQFSFLSIFIDLVHERSRRHFDQKMFPVAAGFTLARPGLASFCNCLGLKE